MLVKELYIIVRNTHLIIPESWQNTQYIHNFRIKVEPFFKGFNYFHQSILIIYPFYTRDSLYIKDIGEKPFISRT